MVDRAAHRGRPSLGDGQVAQPAVVLLRQHLETEQLVRLARSSPTDRETSLGLSSALPTGGRAEPLLGVGRSEGAPASTARRPPLRVPLGRPLSNLGGQSSAGVAHAAPLWKGSSSSPQQLAARCAGCIWPPSHGRTPTRIAQRYISSRQERGYRRSEHTHWSSVEAVPGTKSGSVHRLRGDPARVTAQPEEVEAPHQAESTSLRPAAAAPSPHLHAPLHPTSSSSSSRRMPCSVIRFPSRRSLRIAGGASAFHSSQNR